MASKRDLKKAIRRSCGALAGECVIMQAHLADQTDPEKWDDLIIESAMIQVDAVRAISAPCPEKRRQHANPHAYKKARRAFVRTSVADIKQHMVERMQQVVKQMNELAPKKD